MWLASLCCHLRQTPRRSSQGAFERVAQVDQDMVAISDLPGSRSAACGCLRIRSRTITTDDLHSPVCPQPADNGIGFSIRQDLDWTMGSQIDQQCAVAVAFFPGEIVESQHLRGLVRGNIRAADEPQERLAAGGHREALRQLRARFASDGKRDLPEGVSLSQRPPGVGARQLWEAFRKGGTWAAPGATHEAAYLQAHAHRSSLARQISERARVAASDVGRWLHTLRAYCARLVRFHDQGQPLVIKRNLGQTQIRRQREEGG